ncbi:peptidoglycan DD-metalloendopeptidase family protein [candidate division KSB1 bacterium]
MEFNIFQFFNEKFSHDAVRFLLTFHLQVSILLLTALGIVRLLKKYPVILRNRILAAAFILIPLIPAASMLIPESETPKISFNVLPLYEIAETANEKINILPEEPAEEMQENSVQKSPAEPVVNIDPWKTGLILYGLFTLLFLGLVFAGRLRLKFILLKSSIIRDKNIYRIFREAADELGLKTHYSIVENRSISIPFTAGVFRQYVVLPELYISDFTNSEIRRIAKHELAHIKRRDSLLFTYISFVRALCFINPLIWFASKQVYILSEQACDIAVLESDPEPVSYAKLLTRIAEQFDVKGFIFKPAAGMFFSKNPLLPRIRSILNYKENVMKNVTKPLLTGITIALMAVFIVSVSLSFGYQSKQKEKLKQLQMKLQEQEQKQIQEKWVLDENVPSGLPTRPLTKVKTEGPETENSRIQQSFLFTAIGSFHVAAVKGGTVKKFEKAKNDPKQLSIIIANEDGVVVTYSPVNSIYVDIGDKVKKGEMIGFRGHAEYYRIIGELPSNAFITKYVPLSEKVPPPPPPPKVEKYTKTGEKILPPPPAIKDYDLNITISRPEDSGALKDMFTKNKSQVLPDGFISPVAPGVVSHFGWMKDPFTKERVEQHNGTDFRGQIGAPVYATANGIVEKAEKKWQKGKGMGMYVKISHKDGSYKTLYAHLSEVFVKEGDKVKKGDKIGAIGDTGRVTGPHLHYEIQQKGTPVDPIDYTFPYIIKK